MPDWNTRLAASYTDDAGKTVDVTPIDAFTPTFALVREPIHSLEATHVGAGRGPGEVVVFAGRDATMTVKAIGPVAGQLTELALKAKRFSLLLQETNDGHDWAFKSIVLEGCVITGAFAVPGDGVGGTFGDVQRVRVEGHGRPEDRARPRPGGSKPAGDAWPTNPKARPKRPACGGRASP